MMTTTTTTASKQQQQQQEEGSDSIDIDINNAAETQQQQDSSSSTTTTTTTRRRLPFVSRHRQQLDRIRSDSMHSMSYPVPHHHKSKRSSLHNTVTVSNSGSSSDGEEDGLDLEDNCIEDGNDNSNTTISPYNSNKSIGNRCNVSSMLPQKSNNEWIETFLPCWKWMRTYQWRSSSFVGDLVAGLTVGIMVVPQSMSYAKLAGLPVEYGLYSALMPVYAYAIFGSSRQLAIGPVALLSLILSTGLPAIIQTKANNAEGNNNGSSTEVDMSAEYQTQYNILAIQTSFLVGLTYILMGICRLGFVTIFLSHAVISGFTTGAAIIIGCSQLKYIFGYEVERSDRIYEILYNLFSNLDQFNWKTFVMGTVSILWLVAVKNIGKYCASRNPKLKWVRAIGPLSITVIAIALVAIADLDNKGIPVVGSIPQGLPNFTGSWWTPIDSSSFGQLFVVVISIVIVGFMESIAIAKQLASKHRYEIDSSTELIGLGMANFAGAMFQSYPVTGSFSRSAVNNESGAQSGISGIVTATIVALVLLFLTAVFELLPLNTLAAIVISGIIGLIDYDEMIKLWKVHKFDFAVWLTACLGTMFLGVEIGLAIAVGVSLLIVIYESAYPHTAVLGRLPGTSVYRNIKQYPQAERYDGIVIARIDAPLFFANAQNVRDKLRKYRLAAEHQLLEEEEGRSGDAGEGGGGENQLKYLIVELTPVSHIDTSALHILEDMLVNYSSRGQQLCFSNPSLNVMQRFVASGFADRVGREQFFSCSHDAVNWCLGQMDIEAMSEHLSTTHGAGGRDSPLSVQEDQSLIFLGGRDGGDINDVEDGDVGELKEA